MKQGVSRTEETGGAGERRRDLGIAAALVGIGGLVVALALRIDPGVQTDPLGPRLFPLAMGTAIGVCGLLLAVCAFAPGRWTAPAPILAESGDNQEPPGEISPARLIAAVLLTGAYVAAFEPLGYLLATPPYVTAIVLVHGGARGRALLVPPLLLTAAFYATFRFGLLIPVPDGLLSLLGGDAPRRPPGQIGLWVRGSLLQRRERCCLR
jgi:putative tricarboxylic transport membrane protein